MSDRCLVTGATGFVGRALVARLAAEPGMAIRGAVQDPAETVPPSIERVDIGDIAAMPDWSAAMRDVTCVMHLAGRVHQVREAAADPLAEYLHVNVAATEHLARAAARVGVRRFVYVSSVKATVTSTSADCPAREDDPPPSDLRERDPYGFSKLEAEYALARVARESGLEVTIVRPPLVYGPGVQANFAALVRLVRAGVPLPLGAIHNARSLVGLDNLVDFLVSGARRSEAAGQIFYVSDGEDLSTPELVRRIAAALGRRPRLLAVPEWLIATSAAAVGQGAAARRVLSSLRVDIGKARSRLGWKPPFSVDHQMQRALQDA